MLSLLFCLLLIVFGAPDGSGSVWTKRSKPPRLQLSVVTDGDNCVDTMFKDSYDVREHVVECPDSWGDVRSLMFLTGLQKSGTTVVGHWLSQVLDVEHLDDCEMPRHALAASEHKSVQCKKADCASEQVVRRIEKQFLAERDVGAGAYGDGHCWRRRVITKQPDHGDNLPNMIECLRTRNIPVVFVVRNPYDWVRSQCNRLVIDCTRDPATQSYDSLASASRQPLFRACSTLYWEFLVGTNRYSGRACPTSAPVFHCFAEQWADNLRNALTLARANYRNVYVFDYDKWRQSKNYEYGARFLRHLHERGHLSGVDRDELERALAVPKNRAHIVKRFKAVGTDHSRSAEHFFGPKAFAGLERVLHGHYQCYLNSNVSAVFSLDDA